MTPISDRVRELMARTTYKSGYWFECVNYETYAEIRIGFERPDVRDGAAGIGYGSSARIYPDFTDGDIVRTMFGLAKALEEHETREWFKVDGSQVFGPHIELDALIEAGRHVQGLEAVRD